jgi:hypothetical protein
LNKKQILKTFLDTIFEISDLEFQDRIWIKGLGPECSSFDEAICHFFDDGESIFNNYKSFKITTVQYQKILCLKNKLRNFCDANPIRIHEEEIIFDPEWIEIRKIAADVLKAFNYVK